MCECGIISACVGVPGWPCGCFTLCLYEYVEGWVNVGVARSVCGYVGQWVCGSVEMWRVRL